MAAWHGCCRNPQCTSQPIARLLKAGYVWRHCIGSPPADPVSSYVCVCVTQVKLGGSEYGRYGTRIHKAITKSFYPRIYSALKPLADEGVGMRDVEIDRDGKRSSML
jgi:hypothetical protein